MAKFNVSVWARQSYLILLLLFISLLAGCSFSSDFVVVNASTGIVEVRYKIRGETEELFLTVGKPALLPASQLSERQWRELSPEQFSVDQVNRTVRVLVKPGDALRVYHGGEYREGGFMVSSVIEKLEITAASGAVSYQGDQLAKRFVPESKSFFGPPTILILTYK